MTLIGKFVKNITVAWENITGKPTIPDISDYYNKSEVDALIPIVPAIPDQLSDLSEDITHRTVTDTEKTTWNGKADASHIHTGTLIFTYNL